MKNFWAKGQSYCAKHVSMNAFMHVFVGLGIAWLVSLSWHYAIPPLVAGAIFLVAGIAMHIHAMRTGGVFMTSLTKRGNVS